MWWGGLLSLGPRQVQLHRPPTPTRNPPWRGIRCALPCRRVAPGFAVPARAAACCLVGGAPVPRVYTNGYEWRGAEKSAIWGGVDVASDNLQDSSHRRLARAPRRGLRGQSPQVNPTTFASRAVRRSPVSRFFPCPVGILRTPVDTNPKLAFTSRYAGLALQLAVAVAACPAVVTERVAAGKLIFPRRRSWVLVLVAGHGLRSVDGERPGRAVDGELIQAHFGVADELWGLVRRMCLEPACPAVAALGRGHGGVVVGAVALLVCLLAPLRLFKAVSACN